MNKKLNISVVVALVLVTAAVYLRVYNFPFCEIDDRDYVNGNSHVAAGLCLDSIRWAFTTFHASNWHPMTWLSLMADSQLFGTDPMGYHLVNVFLHCAGAALLFVLFNYLTGAVWRSAFVAACFALHPLHVESVAWISERKDVLSALFWMGTLLAYSVYAKQGRRSMYHLSLVLFAVGLLAKPMLVTIPVVLLILDLWPLQRLSAERLKGVLLEKIPFLALTLVSAAVTVYAQNKGGAVASLSKFALGARISNSLWSVLMYLVKGVVPVDLAIYYPFLPIAPWKAALALAFVVAVTCVCVMTVRRRPWLLAGWLWYLVTLLPVIGLVQVGGQAMADRYTYIPLIGPFAVAAWEGAELCGRFRQGRQVAALLSGAVLALLATLTCFQLSYWEDNKELLTHAVEVTQDNYVVGYALGLVYENEGDKDLAMKQYRYAIKAYPENPEIHLLHLHLGNMLNDRGQSREALAQFEAIIKEKPGFWQAHFNKGVALEKLGMPREALACYYEALRLRPDDASIHNNIGRVLAQQGSLDQAIEQFKVALQMDPTSESIRRNIDTATRQKGRKLVQ